MGRLAHAMAMANPKIVAEVVEVSEFPHLAQRYQVHGVPKTVINDKVEVLGAVPEETFLAHVLRALSRAPEQPGPDASGTDAPTSPDAP